MLRRLLLSLFPVVVYDLLLRWVAWPLEVVVVVYEVCAGSLSTLLEGLEWHTWLLLLDLLFFARRNLKLDRGLIALGS